MSKTSTRSSCASESSSDLGERTSHVEIRRKRREGAMFADTTALSFVSFASPISSEGSSCAFESPQSYVSSQQSPLSSTSMPCAPYSANVISTSAMPQRQPHRPPVLHLDLNSGSSFALDVLSDVSKLTPGISTFHAFSSAPAYKSTFTTRSRGARGVKPRGPRTPLTTTRSSTTTPTLSHETTFTAQVVTDTPTTQASMAWVEVDVEGSPTCRTLTLDSGSLSPRSATLKLESPSALGPKRVLPVLTLSIPAAQTCPVHATVPSCRSSPTVSHPITWTSANLDIHCSPIREHPITSQSPPSSFPTSKLETSTALRPEEKLIKGTRPILTLNIPSPSIRPLPTPPSTTHLSATRMSRPPPLPPKDHIGSSNTTSRAKLRRRSKSVDFGLRFRNTKQSLIRPHLASPLNESNVEVALVSAAGEHFYRRSNARYLEVQHKLRRMRRL